MRTKEFNKNGVYYVIINTKKDGLASYKPIKTTDKIKSFVELYNLALDYN